MNKRPINQQQIALTNLNKDIKEIDTAVTGLVKMHKTQEKGKKTKKDRIAYLVDQFFKPENTDTAEQLAEKIQKIQKVQEQEKNTKVLKSEVKKLDVKTQEEMENAILALAYSGNLSDLIFMWKTYGHLFDTNKTIQDGDTGNTPLHLAGQKGHWGCWQFLLWLGFDPKVPNKQGERPTLTEPKTEKQEQNSKKPYKSMR